MVKVYIVGKFVHDCPKSIDFTGTTFPQVIDTWENKFKLYIIYK